MKSDDSEKKMGKFEDFIQFDMSMYDKSPYQRDSDKCGSNQLGLVSGNVIKYDNVAKASPFTIKPK